MNNTYNEHDPLDSVAMIRGTAVICRAYHNSEHTTPGRSWHTPYKTNRQLLCQETLSWKVALRHFVTHILSFMASARIFTTQLGAHEWNNRTRPMAQPAAIPPTTTI